jgi:(4-(4-[2-(gamma-L-glutamylamino)ethyl]phenoxymethyl)furan-2-yl)methanamine synthase
MPITAGYDVGGAHLKVALAENGRTFAARQIACPLWRGLETLDAAFAEAELLTARADRHAVTMTGELCELFPDRRTGVGAILGRLQSILPPGIRIWMGPRGFGRVDEALADPMSVASTNFLASASLVGRKVPDALLIDMGSTTTDIIAIAGGKPAPRGLTDGERLGTGELVYTGLTRTDVSVVAQRATFRGRAQRLAAGGFANMADVRRILGTLPADVDQHATLDGRGTSVAESIARFARCFGRDAADAAADDWRACAREVADRQIAEVRDAVHEVLSASALPGSAPIIAAGIGDLEVVALATSLGRASVGFGTLAAATPDCSEWATRCAPAVAAALLAS